MYLPLVVPDNCSHTSDGQKIMRICEKKTKTCLLNIVNGGEKFWPTLWFNYIRQTSF